MFNEQVVEESFQLAADALLLLGNHFVEGGLDDEEMRPPVIARFRDGWERAKVVSAGHGIPLDKAWLLYKEEVVAKTIRDVKAKMEKNAF